MAYGRRRALLELAMWAIAAIGFGVSFFGYGGPDTYVDESTRRAVGGAFLAFGLLGHPLAEWWLRRRTGVEPVLVDERDESVGRKATSAALIVVMIFVFVVAIGLWETFEDGGQVPVSWMWFLAYATVVVGHLSGAVASLVVDAQLSGRAEG